MGGSRDAPEMPDPLFLIQEQARQNRVNTSSPFGGQRWSEGPDGQWTQETFLSPQMEQMLAMAFGQMQQGPQSLQTPGMDGLQHQFAQRIGNAQPMQGPLKGPGAQAMPPPRMQSRGQFPSTEYGFIPEWDGGR